MHIQCLTSCVKKIHKLGLIYQGTFFKGKKFWSSETVGGKILLFIRNKEWRQETMKKEAWGLAITWTLFLKLDETVLSLWNWETKQRVTYFSVKSQTCLSSLKPSVLSIFFLFPLSVLEEAIGWKKILPISQIWALYFAVLLQFLGSGVAFLVCLGSLSHCVDRLVDRRPYWIF